MKIAIDLNVLLDVAQKRPAFYQDSEDSVVAATADSCGCDYIVTRKVPDFAGSPVPAVTPADFLKLLPPRASGQAAVGHVGT